MQSEVRASGRPAWELRGKQANPRTGPFSGPGRTWTGEGTRAVRQKPVVERARIENSGLCVPFPEMETGFIIRQTGKVGRFLIKRDLGISLVDIMSGRGQKGSS